LNSKLQTLSSKIYAISPTNIFSKDFSTKLTQVLESGVQIIQLRCKKEKISSQEKIKLKNLVNLIHRSNGICILNDHFSLVEAINADGLHIGQSDIDPVLARRLLPSKIIGISCYQFVELAYLAKKAHLDYVSFGAFDKSSTKKDVSIIKKSEYKKINQFKELPKVIIGGIKNSNFDQSKLSKFDMIAVSSGIFNEKNIPKAIKGLITNTKILEKD